MGWDADLICPTCECSKDHWGHTYNTNKMIRQALSKCGFSNFEWTDLLNGQSGKTGGDFLSIIIDEMELNKPEYVALNPENGWGSYDSILRVLREMRDAGKDNPARIFRIT